LRFFRHNWPINTEFVGGSFSRAVLDLQRKSSLSHHPRSLPCVSSFRHLARRSERSPASRSPMTVISTGPARGRRAQTGAGPAGRTTAAAGLEAGSRSQKKQIEGVIRGQPRRWMRSPRKSPKTPSRIPRSPRSSKVVAKENNGFASYDEYNNVIDNIGNPCSLASIRRPKKICRHRGRHQDANGPGPRPTRKMSAKDKKDALDELNPGG